MSHRTSLLVKRRTELLQRSSQQRARLSCGLRLLDARLHTADDGIAAVQRYLVNPVVAVLAVGALLLFRRRPGPGALLQAWLLLSAGRRVAGDLGRRPGRLGEKATIDGKAV